MFPYLPGLIPTLIPMALSATIFKAALQIADLDRHYYADHALTLARHPSETDERMMVRLLAFAMNADEALTFGRGLSAEDEPDLCNKDLTGAIRLWIEVGLPDDKAIRKACSRAQAVRVYSYGGQAAEMWRKHLGGSWGKQRPANLEVFSFDGQATRDLARLARRNMQLQVTLQEGRVMFTDGEQVVELEAQPI